MTCLTCSVPGFYAQCCLYRTSRPGRREVKWRIETAPRTADHDQVASLSDVVAASVRAERARRHWTQADLAAKTGLSRTTIGDIESGRRQVTVNHLPLFCRALGVPLSVLIAGADPGDLAALTPTSTSR